jgi:pSer/pThr/pTyr-binding forkhead associated (FHA) protein
MTLGRESADHSLGDDQVSRRHAEIRIADNGLEIADKGSLNGTWVNGERIESPVLLNHGDRIQLGTTVLEVEALEEQTAKGTVLGSAPVDKRTAARETPAGASPAPGAGVPGQAAAGPGPAAPPPQSFAPASPPGRRKVATRRATPTLFSLAVILATAVALLLYFAQRS